MLMTQIGMLIIQEKTNPKENKTVEVEHLSKEDRLRLLNSIYVAHPDAEKILKKIERCHKSRTISSEPRSMSLTGETGSGKTTLIEQYMLRHPTLETAKTTTIPIFKSIIQPNTSIRDFIISVLKSLVSRVSNQREDDVSDELLKGSLPAIRKRLYKYIAVAEVKLIILDEFQHLISSKSKKVLNDIADTIKTIINETKVPVILVGTTKANEVFVENPEMARRISEKIRLKPFSISSEEELKTYRKFLAHIDKSLPFIKLSNLAQLEMSIRFFAASNGYIDDTMRIIQDAGYSAIHANKDAINLEDLADAFENNPGQNQQAEGNPFIASYDELKKWACIENAQMGITHKQSSLRKTSDIF
ncbi:MAG TPA: DEAD/DEAH box helicase [Methylophaga aminisulfidivorans]|nr:DEAD/DEAH box helicase [Methylophaga sp.]HIM41089.1 DEAD/DEAH box helicase [Methylophaga aminisulfidivorans]